MKYIWKTCLKKLKKWPGENSKVKPPKRTKGIIEIIKEKEDIQIRD